MNDLDLSVLDELDDGPTDEQLGAITALAKRQVAMELNISQVEEELRKLKADLRKVREELLPDAMAAVGIKDFTLDDGKKVVIKEEVYASISEAKRPSALGWLRDHGHGAIIKNNLSLLLRAEDKREMEVIEFLEKQELEYNQKQTVHPRTLQSWVKEQLAQGEEVPASISYHEQRISKVVS